jgi:hypothetical protein
LFANFLDDFDLFRDRGQIGAVLSIEVPSDTPEVGSVCPVTFRTCGMAASASIDGQGRFGVSDGEVIRLRMREDRPYRIQLFSDVGAEAASVTLTPCVFEPEITALTLPISTTYADNLLDAKISSRHAVNIRILYRIQDDQDVRWQVAHLDQGGYVTLPITQRPHSLFVRVELASRHAEYSNRAHKVVEQRVVIDHPEPHWWASANHPVYRHETVQLPLHFKWVRSAQINYNGRIVQAQLHEGLHHTTVDVVTSEIGVQQIPVELTDLAGAQRQITIPIDVLPRRFAMNVVAQADSAIEITIEGGNQPRLSVPARSVEIELPDTGGVISHGFLLPTQAQIVVLDDQGVEQQTQFLLKPPEHQWQQLPTFSQLSAWRI